MRAIKQSKLLPVLACGLLLLASCTRTPKEKDFTPPTERAQKALEAALTHLQGGNRPGPVPGTTPRVEFVDTRWKPGQQLQAFEILGEDSGVAGESIPRFFKVRLTLTKGPPQEVRFVVVGIDPLWVYREEDYQSLSGMSK